MKSIKRNSLAFLALISITFSQVSSYQLYGFITDSTSGEALIGANVFIKETESSDPVFHRILVGPFEANMEAAVVDKITSIGIKEFFKTIE